MTSFYETATSGMNFDRFVEDFSNDSAISKFQQHYWTAKQLIYTRLGKKEDEHITAADMEFDVKLNLFNSIRETTKCLHYSMDTLHRSYVNLNDNIRYINYLLKNNIKYEKERLRMVFEKFTHSFDIISILNRKLICKTCKIYTDVKTFNERAVGDCLQTIEMADKSRIEYRGSLLWMKNISEELDPDANNQMNKFRTAQQVVKRCKSKLDKLKEDTEQKVELLDVSRNHLLSLLLVEYRDGFQEFYSNGINELNNLLQQLEGIDNYEIDILKILNDPVGKVLEEQAEAEKNNINEDNEEKDKTINNNEEIKIDDKNELINMNDEEECDDLIRIESPLGILNEESEIIVDDGWKSIPLKVGPLDKLIDISDNNIEIPKLSPPPKYGEDCNKHLSWIKKVKTKAGNILDSIPTTTSNLLSDIDTTPTSKYCPSLVMDKHETLSNIKCDKKDSNVNSKWDDILKQLDIFSDSVKPSSSTKREISEMEDDLINLL
ncbi:Arfaptin homology (AH) domain and Arfaptin homology (AH) domain/BAR domain-containing protein [Strongyloides ratti]|uniref:Arfaptin homology (AH) domain and Arfaptin homology (AH) domain/BAR domain-containing protein n=1 Tax=Strongyloides ratti TaxID=34506 RepID=A0A090LCT0_STRRB|nr:Arfaptin homology (AH) domain and Arfaptin homology (AH) domain/BAR domain-containing protein [Strongyloides ratti]CEF65300.1 Arfaptin homology (AH) domain and Arfaptin homology (AH) domain/BAR domain-containing protein [Strongyloides ratti]